MVCVWEEILLESRTRSGSKLRMCEMLGAKRHQRPMHIILVLVRDALLGRFCKTVLTLIF
jgi:hypothetical protein